MTLLAINKLQQFKIDQNPLLKAAIKINSNFATKIYGHWTAK